MTTKDLDVNPRISQAALKAGLSNAWNLLEITQDEIMSKTGLNSVDAEKLILAASNFCSPAPTTAFTLNSLEDSNTPSIPYIKLGCKGLDEELLHGGIPCRGITEIAGQSGSGKTQLLLQLSIRAQLPRQDGGLSTAVAYICTENQFPVSRLNQLIKQCNFKAFNQKSFSDNIFVQHLPDMDQLLDCILYKLPTLLKAHVIKVVIIDSVAAVFRAEEGSQVNKSKIKQRLGYNMHKMAFQKGVSFLVANQVTASFGMNVYGSLEDIIPALGLSWANIITTRIMLWKTFFCVSRLTNSCPEEQMSFPNVKFRVRNMEILFCPWLPRRSYPFVVTDVGIEDTDGFNEQYIAPEI